MRREQQLNLNPKIKLTPTHPLGAAFDMDVDVSRRQLQPKFYGMIPDDNNKRGRSFMLMTLISALHNISRSVGYALMMSTDPLLLAQFAIGEFGLYIFWKVSRNDFLFFAKFDGALTNVVGSLMHHTISKVVADFSGCLHLRHCYGLGGLAFSLSVAWAQAFPFVALQLYDDQGDLKKRENIQWFVLSSFVLWAILTIWFLATIDLRFLHTFFTSKTAAAYTITLYKEATTDEQRFDAVFSNRMSFTAPIHDEIKVWVVSERSERALRKTRIRAIATTNIYYSTNSLCASLGAGGEHRSVGCGAERVVQNRADS